MRPYATLISAGRTLPPSLPFALPRWPHATELIIFAVAWQEKRQRSAGTRFCGREKKTIATERRAEGFSFELRLSSAAAGCCHWVIARIGCLWTIATQYWR